MTAEVDRAALLAAAAFRQYATCPGEARARFLRTIADGIEALGDGLIDCVSRETALPAARIAGERARTCMQLRLFADIADQGKWNDERVDAADPARTPPRPRICSGLRPIGPAAVFAASNFPLAFSVAGGDTAAALAVGCPVVLKAHPAHPETSARVGGVVAAAVASCRLPAGTFSVVTGSAHEVGLSLVRHPLIKVGAFTGSLGGGLALWRAAQARDEPIPFFAEMGSVNPLFVFADALHKNAEAVATGLHASMTLGVGQFCTQPGLVFLVADDAAHAFLQRLATLVSATPCGAMLSETHAANYRGGVAGRVDTDGVRVLGRGEQADAGRAAEAVLLAVDAETFVTNPRLADEIFGPTTLVVTCASTADFVRCAEILPGQLTATIWCEGDADRDLLWTLEQKAGRIVFNGFPTGVEVGAATMHGGPYPATTDCRFTSVGTRALSRFVRPVAWQTPA